FLFEAVVTRFEAKNVEELDLRLLEVTLLFNNISVSITAGRINVNEIVSGFGIDFVVDPISLRSKLEEQGIQMMVCYAAEILGAGVIMLPKMCTDRIVDGMNEIMHLDSCQIENDAGKPVGSIEILIRLMIKCDE
ncbi:CG3199, partial [Drosophila busckii]